MGIISLSSIYSKNGNSAFTGEISWGIVELTDSYATIQVILTAWITAGYTYATIDGSIETSSGTVASGNWGGISSEYLDGEVEICRGTFQIPFDSSGNASTTVSAYATITNSGSFSGTISGSGAVSATAPEPEASASTITLGAETVQMGKKLLISLDRDSAGCTHTLKYKFGGTSGTIAEEVGSSHAWEVPDLAAWCYNLLEQECTITCDTYLDDTWIGTTEATVTLTVPDPTIPSIEGGEVTLGSKCRILCPRNSTAFGLYLSLKFKDETFPLASDAWVEYYSWTPSYDLAKLIPNLTSGTGTLECITMIGSAVVGTKTTTITVIVPENDITRPEFTADGLTLSPVSSLPDAFAGLYMRGKTGVRGEFSAKSEYSTIAKYALTVGSSTAAGNPGVIDLLVNEGTVNVTATVTDARGFSTTVSTTIQVIPYRNPKVTPYTGYSNIICERAMDTGELNPNGTYLAIKAGRAYSSVMLDGVEMNNCALRYRWKPNGVDAYSEWITLLAEGSAETEISLLVGNVVSSLQKSYMVEIEAVDALEGSHKLTFQIMTEAISFVLYDGPDGAGFGKYPEAPHVVDIASHMTLLVRGKMKVLGDDWVSIGLADLMGESGYDYGRKETGCFYLVTEGRHVHIAFNCMYIYAGTAVIVNATPIPEDNRPARPVFSLCPANDRQIACVSVDTDGYIRVEWVQKATDSVLTGNTDVTWLDGYLCYWT